MAAVVVLPSCKAADVCDGVSGTCVSLHVVGSGLSTIEQLAIDLSGSITGGPQTTPLVPLLRTLPIDVALSIGGPAMGQVRVHALGLSQSRAVGEGSVAFSLASGHQKQTLILEATSPPDMAVADASIDLLEAGAASEGGVVPSRIVAGAFSRLFVAPEGNLLAVSTADANQTLKIFDSTGTLQATLDDFADLASLAGGVAVYVARTSPDAGTYKLGTLRAWFGGNGTPQTLGTNVLNFNVNCSDDGHACAYLENVTQTAPLKGDLSYASLVGFGGTRFSPRTITAGQVDLPGLQFAPITNHFFTQVPNATTPSTSDLLRIPAGSSTSSGNRICLNCGDQFAISPDGQRIAASLTLSGATGLSLASTDGSALQAIPSVQDYAGGAIGFITGSDDVVYASAGADGGLDGLSEYLVVSQVVHPLLGGVGAVYSISLGSPSVIGYSTQIDPATHAPNLMLLPAGSATAVWFDTAGYVVDFRPSGRFSFLKRPTNSPTASYWEIGSPSGAKLATLPPGHLGAGGAFVDDDHFLYVDGSSVLRELTISSGASVALADHVDSFAFLPAQRQIAWIALGGVADGIYLAPAP